MKAMTWVIGAVLLGTQPGGLSGQGSKVALFGSILKGEVLGTTGVQAVRWLPGSLGYLDEASGQDGFVAINPRTGARVSVFTAPVVAKLRAEFPGSGLPFTRFEIERHGRAVRFESGGRPYLFATDSLVLHRLAVPAKVGPLDLATEEPGKYSPTWRHYAFIRDYDNLFLLDTETGAEEQIARGTSEDNLIGFLGAGPWFVWSPDGRRIAYLKADQRGFHQYPILRDLDRKATVERFRYPFTVDPDPPLELHVYDVGTKRDVVVAQGNPAMPFLRDLEWVPDGSELTYQVVSRFENRLELTGFDPRTGVTRTWLVDTSATYLDPPSNFRVLADGRFLWSSEGSGWRHLAVYDRQGRKLRQLTSGEWVVSEVVGIDEKAGVVFFTGVTNLGLEQHLFRVRLDGTGLTQVTRDSGWHEVSLSPDQTAFVDRHSSLRTPPSVTMRAIDGTALRPMATSDPARLTALGLTPPELLTLRGADGVTPIQGILFRPADFDPAKRYPVIVSVYGGPHTKAIRDRFETTDFRAALAQLGFLVFEVDARGTLGRGKAFQSGNYLRMGQVDVDDQAAAVRQLGRRPYVDSTRIGVTGISHGGYLTLMMVLRYPDVFQVGVTGAPITDLRNGPRQYIGRIMRTPDANAEGYEKGDVLGLASTLRSRLLIFYGTNDHNAVVANTMQLARKLIDAGRPFDMAVYPNGDHVLGGADGIHGLKTTVSYFLEHLRPEGWEASRAALWQ